MTFDSAMIADTLRKKQEQRHQLLACHQCIRSAQNDSSVFLHHQLDTYSYKFNSLQLPVTVDRNGCSTKMKLEVLNASPELSFNAMCSAACIFLRWFRFLSEHQREIWISITGAPRNFNQNTWGPCKPHVYLRWCHHLHLNQYEIWKCVCNILQNL